MCVLCLPSSTLAHIFVDAKCRHALSICLLNASGRSWTSIFSLTETLQALKLAAQVQLGS